MRYYRQNITESATPSGPGLISGLYFTGSLISVTSLTDL